MLLDHRALHRVQRIGLADTLDGDQQASVQSAERHEARVCAAVANARAVRMELGDQDQAGAAVSFGAAFLRASQPTLLAKVLQHGLRVAAPCGADDLAVMGVDHLCRVHAGA